MTTKPLSGVKVLELGGIGPMPHVAMTLADWGADVVRIERPDTPEIELRTDTMMRNRKILRANLKVESEFETVRDFAHSADILLDGFRPGVTERLGLGPDAILEANPGLVYGRLSSWGQTGPLSQVSGHDINFLAIAGVLDMIGPSEQPLPPFNLVGDYGGGSMVMVGSLLAALLYRARTGAGQIIDLSALEGVAHLTHTPWTLEQRNAWSPDRASNLLDGGAPFYTTYECSDGRFIAVGAIEPKFYNNFVVGLGLDPDTLAERFETQNWGSLRALFAEVIAQRPRDEWAEHFAGLEACVTPVLTRHEASKHPHLAERGVYVPDAEGHMSPAPTPRFSLSPEVQDMHGFEFINHPAEVLRAWREH